MDSGNQSFPSNKPIAIIAITSHGAGLALQLQTKLAGSVCYVSARHKFAIAMGAVGFPRIGGIFPEIWGKSRALICIMATGIVVRQIAPLLKHKTMDPAVVVLDERGQFVISLLSGHVGGANRLALEVARLTGGQAVITTASDVREKPALDLIARQAGLEIENIEMLSRLARAILEDEPVWVHDPEGRLMPFLEDQPNLFPFGESGVSECGEPASDMPKADVGLWVSERSAPPWCRWLMLRPRNLVVGLGCNRSTPADEILDLVQTVFEREGLSLLSIRNLASVDIKSDEPGLLEAGKTLNRPIRFYTREEIENIHVPNPSSIVATHIGVRSVCEATALLSARSKTILIEKRKTANVTLAVARAAFPL
jgi:cobalt-precorrin 5A hydrolase